MNVPPPVVMTVHTGDEHVGSTVGLCPPRVELDSGGYYHASPVQLFYWDCWQRFWDDTALLKHKYGAYVVGISGGDEGEGDHHGTTQIWFEEDTDQERAIDRVMEVANGVVDHWEFVRGTLAHNGTPEQRARRFKAKGWNVGGDSEIISHWVYTGEWAGVKFEEAHAPGTKSWVGNTQGPACARHAQYTRSEYHESGIEPPDIVIRHHVHYWEGPGCHKGTCCFFVPAWQAPTHWVLGRGVKSAAPAGFIPGGLRIICQDGTYFHSWKLFQPPSGVAWAK